MTELDIRTPAPSDTGRLLDDGPAPVVARQQVGRSARSVIGQVFRYLILLALLAGSVFVAVREIRQNIEESRRLTITEALLVANQVDIISTSPGTIEAIFFEPGDWVVKGDVVATINAVRPAPGGGEQIVETDLLAPRDGQVAASPNHAGEAVLAGQVLMQLFEPSDVHLEVRVENSGQAAQAEVGMTGRVWTDGVDPITVTLTKIDPGLLTGDRRAGLLTLELRFVDIEVVNPFLLGLQFEGWLDLSTNTSEESS